MSRIKSGQSVWSICYLEHFCGQQVWGSGMVLFLGIRLKYYTCIALELCERLYLMI